MNWQLFGGTLHTLPSRLRFRHVINLADGMHRRDPLGNIRLALHLRDTKLFQGSVYDVENNMFGTFAYALSPAAGARRLVEATRRKVACEADIFIDKDKVDLIEHYPLPVKLNENFPSCIERRADLLR